MKVLFIQPNNAPTSLGGDLTSIHEPLSLEYISAGLGELAEKRFLDLRLEPRLEETIREYQPRVVGITGYTVHINVVKKAIRTIRSIDSRIIIVIGGHHATISHADYLDAEPEYIIKGEGISVFRELVRVLKTGQDSEALPEEISVVKTGRSRILESSAPMNIRDWPFPDRSLTAKYRKEYFSYWMKPLASIRSSDGCLFRCKFCTCWKLAKGKYYARSPESIVEELASIKEENVYFADDESFLDINRMKELAALLKQSGIKKKYHMFARADTIVKHKDLFRQWKEVGLDRLFVGFEATTNERLKWLNKGTSVKTNAEALEFLNANNIKMIADFIIMQDFTKQDFRDLGKYVTRMKIPSVVYTILTPMPGTELFETEKDRLIDTQFEHFDVMHTLLPPDMGLKEFYREFYRLYKSAGSFLAKIKFLSEFSLQELLKLIKLYGTVSKKLKRYYLSEDHG